ncbi:hypothetical protein O181_017621 [Austropuccinia psidii MF-1]|uniref:Uncharacterized protein n=1 Tax=Austropuccinia psidii MF-1 TaxID=1389203 RepID=A0A9Q3C7Y5_9BASI|nr:hypothetical protein [Austropuccinia psidii MF-1]
MLEESHVAVLDCQLPLSEDTCGVRKMGPLGWISQFLSALLLMLVLVTDSKQREVARWTNAGGPIPAGGRQIHSSPEVPISKSNTEGVVKRIRQISNSPPNPDAQGNDELDGEEVEVVLNSSGNQSSTLPSQPASKRFQSQLVPSTPRNFQPVLSTIPPLSPSPSTARPALISTIKQSPIPQPRNSPIVTSKQLQLGAISSRKREDQLPLPFIADQVFQKRERWPIQVTREDPNM